MGRALELMKSTYEPTIKIAVLLLILNLSLRDQEEESESKARKHILELDLEETLKKMRENERNCQVLGYIDRTLHTLKSDLD